MSTQTANTEFSFRLPSLSYIDAKWEEPNLRTAAPAVAERHRGFGAWLAARYAAFLAWRQDNQAASELNAMSDRELIDIGITRSDVHRVFDASFNQDLRNRG